MQCTPNLAMMNIASEHSVDTGNHSLAQGFLQAQMEDLIPRYMKSSKLCSPLAPQQRDRQGPERVDGGDAAQP